MPTCRSPLPDQWPNRKLKTRYNKLEASGEHRELLGRVNSDDIISKIRLISCSFTSLITELRKELRVSDDEHRELLGRVNSDDIISKIRLLSCSFTSYDTLYC